MEQQGLGRLLGRQRGDGMKKPDIEKELTWLVCISLCIVVAMVTLTILSALKALGWLF